VRATRSHDTVMVGAGPRATQALLLASRAFAALEGRDFVSPDDVKTMVHAVLRHRIMLGADLEIDDVTPDDVLAELARNVPAPRR